MLRFAFSSGIKCMKGKTENRNNYFNIIGVSAFYKEYAIWKGKYQIQLICVELYLGRTKQVENCSNAIIYLVRIIIIIIRRNKDDF